MAKRTKQKSNLQFVNKTKSPQNKNTKKKMIFYPAAIADGCTQFRFEWPRQTLNTSKAAEIQITNIVQQIFVDGPRGRQLNPAYAGSDVVVMQRPVLPKHVNLAHDFQKIKEGLSKAGRPAFKFIIDIDDVIHADHIADFNVAKTGYASNERFQIFKNVVNRSDELHVCSPTMQKFYREALDFDKITYRPNFLPKYLYDGFYDERVIKERFEKHKDRPRIVWAGSWTHVDVHGKNNGKDDFSEILDFMVKTKDTYKWVFYGAFPMALKDHIDAGTMEYHKWTSIMEYPQKLWSLEPTVFIAPLEDNVFNRCKSNIKLTETGAMGIAGVFQDLDPYDKASLRFNSVDEMSGHIESLLNSWDHYLKVIRESRRHAEDFFMEDNINLLMSSYLLPYGSPFRDTLCPKLNEIQYE